jgi:hypothetical protein
MFLTPKGQDVRPIAPSPSIHLVRLLSFENSLGKSDGALKVADKVVRQASLLRSQSPFRNVEVTIAFRWTYINHCGLALTSRASIPRHKHYYSLFSYPRLLCTMHQAIVDTTPRRRHPFIASHPPAFLSETFNPPNPPKSNSALQTHRPPL